MITKSVHVKVRDLEDRSISNNFQSGGLSKEQEEDWRGSEAKIKKAYERKIKN